MNPKFLQQAQRLQQQLMKAQQDLANETTEATAGGGAVKVVVAGNLRLRSIEIAREVVDPEDVEMLQDLVLTAVNEGIEKAQEMAGKKLGSITGGMKIPGLM